MHDKVDRDIRAFGMSGAQIAVELREIEAEREINLKSRSKTEKLRKHEDYTNFEKDIRMQASWMSEYYKIFYCLEVSIRRVIINRLVEAKGIDWWETDCVAQGLKTEVAVMRKRESDAGITSRSDNPIDYTTFGQLSQLITDNFALFEPIISSKSAVSRVLNQLNLLRGPIAHCSPLAEDERDRLRLAVKDWFRLLS